MLEILLGLMIVYAIGLHLWVKSLSDLIKAQWLAIESWNELVETRIEALEDLSELS